LNPNNPSRLRVLEVIREHAEQWPPIRTYSQLAEAVGLSVPTARQYAIDWEWQGRLTRDQTGAFVEIAPYNDCYKPGVPKLTQAQIDQALGEKKGCRTSSPRPKRPQGWLRALIMNNELPAPEGPGDPVLGQQIVEAIPLAKTIKADPKPPRLRYQPRANGALYVPPAERLPMPKAIPEPARKLAEDVREMARAADLAAEVGREQRLKAKMERQAAAEERAATSSKFCPRCANQPWRRKPGVTCRCGGEYEPEMVEIIVEKVSPISFC
jgi:hypothetical protein